MGAAALVAGGPVRFSLTVTSSAHAGCAFVPTVDLAITSGADRVWSSGDCGVSAIGGPDPTVDAAVGRPVGSARAVLVPGGSRLTTGAAPVFALVWPGVRSAGSCAADPQPLTPGTYVASITVAGAGSARVAFLLH